MQRFAHLMLSRFLAAMALIHAVAPDALADPKPDGPDPPGTKATSPDNSADERPHRMPVEPAESDQATGAKKRNTGDSPSSAPPSAEASHSESPSTEDIQGWIDALESETYSVREFATQRLIDADGSVIPHVVAATHVGGLETIARCNYVLRQLVISSPNGSTQRQALNALKSIASRRFTSAARRAEASLETVYAVRQQMAKSFLTDRGAVISEDAGLINGIAQRFHAIQFGSTWNGTDDDLHQLRWLVGQHNESDPDPWMVIMEGDQVTDTWIATLNNLDNLGVLKIKAADISANSLATLASNKNLSVLELLYNPLGDEAFQYLEQLEQVDTFRLIGKKMTRKASDAFAQKLAHATVQFKKGGFLGVRCDAAPCRIVYVQPNSAAQRANFRPGDVIVRYNNQPVKTMEELTEEISKHPVGETVSVSLLRSGEIIQSQVTLGAWP